MSKKDYLVVAFIILATTAISCALSLYLGYKYIKTNGAPETIDVARQRFEQKIIVEKMQATLDSIRGQEFKIVNNIRNIYTESKKKVPAISDPDSLVNSVNNLDKILTK